ncbi:membrane-spanning 4-domains subfamily A member 4D-like [Hoplias malabaricus]|uniref:membrane-spanning 4-domains subfamily A member 4D-like n=1 Tax=Hoplias malabaricus TaxID=27720 RepID=UPI003462986F
MDTAEIECNVPEVDATTQTNTGGIKPLHRFLRAEPKVVGVVMMFMGFCLFIFGIPLKTASESSSAYLYSSFWLGILYCTCGIFYTLAERSPSKKIVTVSLALSIISILGTVVAGFDFFRSMMNPRMSQLYNDPDSLHTNNSELGSHVLQHYAAIYNLEVVFLSQSLIGFIILIVMSVFARLGLHSTRTQAVVVMHNLPSAK